MSKEVLVRCGERVLSKHLFLRRGGAWLLAACIMLAGTPLLSIAQQKQLMDTMQGTPSRPRRSATGDATTTTTTNDPQQQQQTPAPKPTPTQKDDETTLPDDDTYRVETDLTTILFTAVDKNKRFVTTLKQDDLRILENGTPQQIFTFQRETDRPLSLAILIDTSASQERTLPDEKNAARRFVDEVIRPNKDEVAIVSFTGDATLEQGLTSSLSRIRRAIDRVEFQPPSGYIGNGQIATGTPPISGTNQSTAGSTAIWDAIYATSNETLAQTSEKTRRAIILVTDGINTSGELKMADAIDRAIKSDSVIYCVGIGDYYGGGVDEGSLRKLSERTGGRAFFPKDENDLHAAFSQIQQELRSQYLIAYSPTNKAHDGSYRQVKIEITNPDLRKENLRLTYRQGYFAKSDSPNTKTRPRRP